MNDQTKMWIYAIGGGVILALIAAKAANAQSLPKRSGGGGLITGGNGNNNNAGCASVIITTTSGPLSVRAEPTTSSSKVGEIGSGATVEVDAQVEGQSVSGTTTWYHLKDNSGYISGAYSRCV
jgi:hypothetical protein